MVDYSSLTLTESRAVIHFSRNDIKSLYLEQVKFDKTATSVAIQADSFQNDIRHISTAAKERDKINVNWTPTCRPIRIKKNLSNAATGGCD